MPAEIAVYEPVRFQNRAGKLHLTDDSLTFRAGSEAQTWDLASLGAKAETHNSIPKLRIRLKHKDEEEEQFLIFSFETQEEMHAIRAEINKRSKKGASLHNQIRDLQALSNKLAPSTGTRYDAVSAKPLPRHGGTSGYAVASLVFGCLGFFLCGIFFGPLAMWLASKAQDEIRHSPGMKGSCIAQGGKCLGCFTFGLSLVIIVLYLSTYAGATYE